MEQNPVINHEQAVRVAYAAAGFPAGDDDIARAVAAFPIIRGIADMLHTVTVGSEVGSAVTYDPTAS